MHSALPVPGDHVWIRQRRWRVERARRDRHVVCLDVAARGARLTFLTPFDRARPATLTHRLRRGHYREALARLAATVARQGGGRLPLAAIDAKAAILPHQLAPVLAAMHGVRRLLIADSVGMGKTIQAALIVQATLSLSPHARILIVAPATLRDQWADELATRFGLTTRVAGARAMEEMSRRVVGTASPWRQPGIWIASPDYVKQPHVLDALPAAAWDLVVIDEAHTMVGESMRHAAASCLGRRARRLVLLTATPHDGDPARFARLMALGALTGEGTADAGGHGMAVFRRSFTRREPGRDRRVRWTRVTASVEETRLFQALGEYERAVLAAIDPNRTARGLLLLAIFRKRALSTMAALRITLERRLTGLGRHTAEMNVVMPRQARLDFDGEESDELAGTESRLLADDLGVDPGQEARWLRRLIALAEAASRGERKIARLGRLLRRTREPVVIFTEFRHSLDALASRLGRIRPVAVLHGGQTDSERAMELGRFLGRDVDVLLATDVASLGLNLQSRARWVINLELPWNPIRLTQRAGRVDRIGQTRPVHVSILLGRHAADERMLMRLTRRVLDSERAVGAGALDLWMPSQEAVAAALIMGAPLADASTDAAGIVRLPITDRWRRPAVVAARSLEKRRALAARWRSSPPIAGRPVLARVPRASPLARLATALHVFDVPITDRAGLVIERQVVPVVAARAAPLAMVGQVAAGRVWSRVRRLERVMRDIAVLDTATERALLQEVHTALGRAPLQPGLFDQRRLRAARESSVLAEDARVDADAALEALADRSRLQVGTPVLICQLVPEGAP